MSFSQKILSWYTENKRDLPWRRTKDPYKIWLSEIMLQQTRVAQGMPYYEKFVAQFPTIRHLADASEKHVLKLWQGLGYYSRARNLHATAKKITYEYNGEFPDTYEGLLQLKGVGDYTASAIASISFGLPEPVVDGNVYRVLARYFGIDVPINSGKGIKYFKKLAREVMDVDNVRDYNQAIMEFGAIQCAPKKPYCLYCPLNDGCIALQQNRIGDLPVKLRNGKVKDRYFNYLVLLDPELNTELRKREGKGIWQNLYEFPLMESEGEINITQVKNQLGKAVQVGEPEEVYQLSDHKVVHKLSHQNLHTKFWMVKTKEKLVNGIPMKDLEDYPVPVLIADFIKTLKNSYF